MPRRATEGAGNRGQGEEGEDGEDDDDDAEGHLETTWKNVSHVTVH